MTVDVNEFDFGASTGAEVAQESNKGGSFEREVMFLTLKADPVSVQQGNNTAIVRLVTEHERKDWMTIGPTTPYNFAWITVKQHYARTKQRPPYAREGANWPEKMYAVCRKDKVFAAKYNDHCPLDNDNKPSERTWALGIEREWVHDDNGNRIGIRDKMREVLEFDEKGEAIVVKQSGDDKEYKKKWVPAWVVLNFGWKNFFNALNGQAQYFQSVLSRDFFITRTGIGNNDTNYSFVALDPITMGGEWAQAAGVEDGTPYDLGITVGQTDDGRPVPMAERLYPDMPDLRRIIAERTSEDYYGRWFTPGWLPEGFDPSKATGTGGGAPQGGYVGGFQPSGGVNQSGAQQGYTPPQNQQPQQPQAPQSPAPQQGQDQAPGQGADPDALAALRARMTGGGQQPQQQPEQQPAGQPSQ